MPRVRAAPGPGAERGLQEEETCRWPPQRRLTLAALTCNAAAIAVETLRRWWNGVGGTGTDAKAARRPAGRHSPQTVTGPTAIAPWHGKTVGAPGHRDRAGDHCLPIPAGDLKVADLKVGDLQVERRRAQPARADHHELVWRRWTPLPRSSPTQPKPELSSRNKQKTNKNSRLISDRPQLHCIEATSRRTPTARATRPAVAPNPRRLRHAGSPCWACGRRARQQCP